MKTIFPAAGLASLTLLSAAPPASAQDEFDVIAFGSCAREREPQPIWSEILGQNPDLFLFIGDNQYADFWVREGQMVMAPVEDPARFAEAYAELGRKPGYRRLQRTVPIMATWDDHDFGKNDGGAEYPLKREAQDAFLDFFGFRDNAPIREQEGIYNARTFGEDGRRVQVIMLDTRYHRSPLDRAERRNGRGPYVPTSDETKTLLGEAQWAWLKTQLMQPADVRIIASSIQVVSWEHGWETWGNFPHERQRLYNLIAETDASGVVFVSGDRHLMDLCRDVGQRVETDRGVIDSSVPYPMWDFTSSGLTQSPSPVNEPSGYRVGNATRETNFGVIRIEWGDTPAQTAIHFEGFGDQSQLLTRQTVWLSELREVTRPW